MELSLKAEMYIKKTGNTFRILDVDTYRDGGTIGIKCSKDQKFYISFIDGKLYTHIPCKEEYRITDHGLIDYIKERLYTYLKRQTKEVVYLENIFNRLSVTYK